MALVRCDFFSNTLGLSTSMTVILPQRTESQIGLAGSVGDAPPPVLYLLHGLSDDDTTWVRRTSLERYVAPLGLAVVMPQVHRSMYLNEAHGNRYWTFLSEELPRIVATFFQVSDRREETFVAGLSMGGHGAIRWALRHPERFAAAASLSGALDLRARLPGGAKPFDAPLWMQLFGDPPRVADEDDPLWLIANAPAESLPALYIACGTEDPLIGESIHFVDICRGRSVPVSVDLGPGRHDWAYWDLRIRDVLAWLPLPGA